MIVKSSRTFVSSSSVECETLYSGCHRDGEEEQGAGRCNYDDRNDYNDPNDMTTRLGWLKTQPYTAGSRDRWQAEHLGTLKLPAPNILCVLCTNM